MSKVILKLVEVVGVCGHGSIRAKGGGWYLGGVRCVLFDIS